MKVIYIYLKSSLPESLKGQLGNMKNRLPRVSSKVLSERVYDPLPLTVRCIAQVDLKGCSLSLWNSVSYTKFINLRASFAVGEDMNVQILFSILHLFFMIAKRRSYCQRDAEDFPYGNVIFILTSFLFFGMI
jgi:hypothetical protein